MYLLALQIKLQRKAYYQKYGRFPKLSKAKNSLRYPISLERQYFRYIRDYMKSLSKKYLVYASEHYEHFKRELHGDTRLDDWVSEMMVFNEELIDSQKEIPENQRGNVIASVLSIGKKTAVFNSVEFEKFALKAVGIGLIPDEALSTALITSWATLNYELIKSIEQTFMSRANTIVMEGVQQGKLWGDVKRDLELLDKNLSNNRAKLIARDQIGKLNGMLSNQRMTDAGLELYEWQTAGDERVRSTHKLLNGLWCHWSDSTVCSKDKGKTWIPRPSGAPLVHPGIDIQCRCVAIPIFAELVDKIDSEILKESVK
jgi:hypothetical protein